MNKYLKENSGVKSEISPDDGKPKLAVSGDGRRLYKIIIDNIGMGRKRTVIKRFTEQELIDFTENIGKDLPHPMLEEWVSDVETL